MYYTEESGKRTQEKKEMKYDKEIATLKAQLKTETDRFRMLDIELALMACMDAQTEIIEAQKRVESYTAKADRLLKEVQA